MYVPERPIEAPEDTRRVDYTCEFCGGDIMEGDEYFDLSIPTNYLYHKVCTHCMDNWHYYEAECEEDD